MKTPTSSTRNASSNLLGTLLLISLFSTALISINFDALTDLYNTCANQWHNFTRGLYMMQPHRPL